MKLRDLLDFFQAERPVYVALTTKSGRYICGEAVIKAIEHPFQHVTSVTVAAEDGRLRLGLDQIFATPEGAFNRAIRLVDDDRCEALRSAAAPYDENIKILKSKLWKLLGHASMEKETDEGLVTK